MAQHHIACTHTGSLPRPDDLIQLMWAVGDGIPVDREALERRAEAHRALQRWREFVVEAGALRARVRVRGRLILPRPGRRSGPGRTP